MKSIKLVSHVLFSTLALAACSSSRGQDAPVEATVAQDPPAQPASVGARIGAAGGVIEGPKGTVLEGVRLEIPAGALSADTEVAIAQTVDPTPLALTAQQVGPQFAITPADLKLAAPAKLTLPADATWLQEFGAGAGDMKVWTRAGDGWSKNDAIASDAQAFTVTIALDTFTTAAAGAVLAIKPSSCLGTSCLLLQCASGTITNGFCVEDLGSFSPLPVTSARAVHMDANGSLYYIGTIPAAVVAVQKARPFASTPPRKSASVVGLSGSYFNLANRPSDGHLFAGTGFTGNVEFAFDGSTPRVWNPVGGLGAVNVQGGAFDLLGTTSLFQFNDALDSIHGIGTSPILSLDPRNPSTVRFVPGAQGTFVASSTNGGIAAAFDMHASPVEAATGALCANSQAITGILDVAQAPDGTVAVAIGVPNGDFPPTAQTIVCKNGAEIDRIQGGIVAFDGKNGLWVAGNTVAEVTHRAADGTKQTVALSTDPVGSTAYLSRLPISVLAAPAVDGGEAWLVTRTGEFLHLRAL